MAKKKIHWIVQDINKRFDRSYDNDSFVDTLLDYNRTIPRYFFTHFGPKQIMSLLGKYGYDFDDVDKIKNSIFHTPEMYLNYKKDSSHEKTLSQALQEEREAQGEEDDDLDWILG